MELYSFYSLVYPQIRSRSGIVYIQTLCSGGFSCKRGHQQAFLILNVFKTFVTTRLSAQYHTKKFYLYSSLEQNILQHL